MGDGELSHYGEDSVKTIHVEAAVEVPRVPNFLTIDDTQKISIADVSDEELKYIGAAWLENLLERARELRRKRGVKR